MKADWWYSDKFGQVGPFTLKQLKEALSTFGESHKRELWVWREGFSEWKAADILNDLREQNDVLPSQKSGASWLLAQAKDAITRAGKSYWSRLANEFFRDRRDRMRASEIKKTLRPTPTAAEKGCAGAFLFIVGTFGALLLMGLGQPRSIADRVAAYCSQKGSLGAISWAHMEIRNKLKSPDTASFLNDDDVVYLGYCKTRVSGRVYALNSFNAKTLSRRSIP